MKGGPTHEVGCVVVVGVWWNVINVICLWTSGGLLVVVRNFFLEEPDGGVVGCSGIEYIERTLPALAVTPLQRM